MNTPHNTIGTVKTKLQSFDKYSESLLCYNKLCIVAPTRQKQNTPFKLIFNNLK